MVFIWIYINPSITIAQTKADKIFHNGTVITVDNNFSKGSYLAIRGGRVLDVGTGQSFNKWVDPKTELFDLKGRTILPGFIEPHTHPILSAAMYQWIDVSGMNNRSATSALRKLKKAAKTTPKGEWILAFGWDFMLLRDAFPLTRAYLDKEISRDHPIWIMMQSQHTSFFNSMAFEKAGITRNTPNPMGGGEYIKDAQGELSGMVTESAPLRPFISSFKPKTKFDVKTEIEHIYTLYNSKGVTTIGAPGLFPEIYPHNEVLRICEELSNEEPVQLRLFYYEVGTPSLRDLMPVSDNWFLRKIGQKYWIDGSPYTGSMLMKKPYIESTLSNDLLNIPAGSYGSTMFPASAYQNLFLQAHKLGWQIAAHCQGDSAAVHAIDAFRKILRIKPKKDHRFRMEHLALVTPEQLKQMKSLGLTPSFHINHIYYYGDYLAASIIGDKRANLLMPVNHAAQLKHKFSLHSDSPMYPPDPLLAIRTALTRKTSSGMVLGLDQRIDIKEAIKAVTIFPAWQMHVEKEVGSLEKGKRADFVILENNPLNYNPDNLHKIEITATYVEGAKVY